MWELDYKESWALKNKCFWTVVLEKTLESPLDCKEIQPVHPKGNQSWMFIGRTDAEAETPNALATCCEELTHWKTPWCWERLKAGGEGADRGWDSWMASPTQWTWVWVSSGSWWWTGRPGVLQSMGSQRFGHDWATELNYHSPDDIWSPWPAFGKNILLSLMFPLSNFPSADPRPTTHQPALWLSVPSYQCCPHNWDQFSFIAIVAEQNLFLPL